MSFIVHAAARMLKLPSANSASIDMSGRCPLGAAKLMLQAHGRNKSHVPGTIHTQHNAIYPDSNKF